MLYVRISKLFEGLAKARLDGSRPRLVDKLARVQLLILDDWGTHTMNDSQRLDILDICEERYGRKSTLITARAPVDKWHAIVGEPPGALGSAGRTRALRGRGARRGSPSATTTRRFSQTSRCVWTAMTASHCSVLTETARPRLSNYWLVCSAQWRARVVKSPRLRVGYFSQQLTEQLDPSASPIESLVRLRPHDTPERMRTYLGRFGFTNDMALGRIGSLSGGERARLVFAQIAASEPHVLLLDEPTNHLDKVSRDALVEAINEFDGAVVIVSHDPHLIALTVDRFWLVSGSLVASFEGDMADYRALTLERKSRPDELSRTETMPTPSRVTASKKQKRRESAERRREASSLANKVKKAEALVDRLTLEKQAILEKLADPALYRKQPEELKRLQQKIGWLQRDLDAAEAAWIAGQEKLEVRQKVASPNDTANRRPAGSS